MKRLLLGVVALVCTMLLTAQVMPTPNPIPVGYKGEVVITFDPTAGNGGMIGASQCYAHTGLITAASTSNSDWKNVIGSWRGATQPQLTKKGSKWELVIPNIYTFYNVPETTDIKALAFVFHDGPGGTKEGKAASGDIIVPLGEEIQGDIWAAVEGVKAVSKPRPAGISNGIYYGEDGTSVTLCTYAASRTESAKRVFLLGDMTNWRLSADYQLYKDGNYFWITLTGLEKGKEYRFQYAVERADGVRKQICDLYSEKVIHPDDQWEPRKIDPTLISYPSQGADGGYVTVIQPGKPGYEWSEATLHFKRPNRNNLVIYELWVYDFTPQRSLLGVQERLDYLQSLGVNAIELMPMCEFGGNMSWGYNPVLYFALDRAYATPTQFKEFIDECHKRGMAVIMDMVFNHTNGDNPMAKLYPWTSSSESETELRFNPWFNLASEVKHSDNNYGEDWNHDFAPAHEMFKRSVQYWAREYKVDGYRFDLSHGLCGRNTYDAVANLTDYYNGLKEVIQDGYFILEHWGDKAGSDRPTLINEGMLCWLNTNNAYCQTAMGWLKDGDSFTDANKDGYVTYCESHDEERMQYKVKMWGNGDLQTNTAARIARIPANIAFNVLLNGSHMLWQFEEIGYDFSINSELEHPDGNKSDYRCNKKPRPEWRGYFSDANRRAAYTKTAQAIQLRTQLLPNVFAGDPTAASISGGKALRTIQWGNDVFVAGNFSATDAQTVSVPSGTWYNYYLQAKENNTSITLQPGELLILTGSQQALPEIPDYSYISGVEDIMTAPKSEVQKFFYNGTLYLRRGNTTYTIDGRRVE